MAGTGFHSGVDGWTPFECWIKQIYSLQNNKESHDAPPCRKLSMIPKWFNAWPIFWVCHFHHFWVADGKLQGMILPGTPSENMEEICFRGPVDLVDCWLRSSSRRQQMRVKLEHLCAAEATYNRLPRLFSRRIHFSVLGGLGWFVTKCSTNNRTTLYVSTKVLR